VNDPHDLRAVFRRGETDAVSRMAEAAVERARAAGDPGGEVEGLYALARVALRADDLGRAEHLAQLALGVAQRAGEAELEERPRHVLAAVARLSGDHVRARDRYEASVELNKRLGLWENVHSESHNLILTTLHLGDMEGARRLFGESRERVLRGGFRDFLPYLGIAGAALALAEGDADRAARLIGFTDRAFEVAGQVPDPDDARELGVLRNRVAAVLGQEQFESERSTGAAWTLSEAFGRASP
jgi:hypothetical protein